MKTSCIAMLVWLLVSTAAEAGDISWRVSVKFILDEDGNRPPVGNINTDAEVQGEIDNGNLVLDATGRGYQFVLTEIVDLTGVSQWFSVPMTTANRDDLEQAAESDTATYAWRDNAINVYINSTTSGSSGICSFPGAGNDIILLAQNSPLNNLLHESGHFMNLCHTQGCPCGGCNPPDTGQCDTVPGSDGNADTLPDLSCWDQDDIANWTYSVNYAALTTDQQDLVDDVFFNVMSYHSNANRLTQDQMDKATDASNGSRSNVATGLTWFVDINNTGSETGSSSNPYDTVQEGLAAAGAADIVLIRAGDYPEMMTINQPVCLRATRGTVFIGQ